MKKTPKPKVKRLLISVLSKKDIRVIIQRAKKQSIRQCPFCGSEVVYCGPHEACKSSVRCFGCGACVIIDIDEAPMRLKTFKQAEKWCLQESVRRWNKRTLLIKE